MTLLGGSCDFSVDSEFRPVRSLPTVGFRVSPFGTLARGDNDARIRFFRDEIKAAKMET